MICNNSDNSGTVKIGLTIERLLFLCPLIIQLIHSAIRFPNISRIRSHRFMLLSQVVLLIVILIFQLYVTLAQYINQPHILKVSKLNLSSSNTPCDLDTESYIVVSTADIDIFIKQANVSLISLAG